MTNEEKRQLVIGQLRKIDNKLYTFRSNVNGLSNTLSENIKINNKTFKEDEINDILNKSYTVSKKINNDIIPNI